MKPSLAPPIKAITGAPIVQGEPLNPVVTQCRPPSKIGCVDVPPVIACRPPSKVGCVISTAPSDDVYSAPQDAGFGFEILLASLMAWVLK